MKVGDLVKVKHEYSNNESGIGVIVKVEEGFYKEARKDIPPPYDRRLTVVWSPPSLDHRLTIFWSHGEITHEPYAYVDLIKL